MPSKGFGQIPQKVLVCETTGMDMDSGVSCTAYKSRKGLFADLNELLSQYGLSPDEPGIQDLKIHLVKPKGNHPEVKVRRAIDSEDFSKLLDLAMEKGSLKGQALATKDMHSIVSFTSKERGITGAVFKDGIVTPLDKEGNEMPQHAFDTKGEHPAQVHIILLSDRSPLKEINERVGANFYANLPAVVLRRVRSFENDRDIASYLTTLGTGLFIRGGSSEAVTRGKIG